MIDLIQFEKIIGQDKLDNVYIFLGPDENLIKENVEIVVNKALGSSMRDFNLIRFDGEKVEYQEVFNACETLPFMSEKKVVVVYRADFLKDGEKSKDGLYKNIKEYVGSANPQTVLILYYVFDNPREKESKKVKALDKKATIIKADKLKGMYLQKKVKDIFEAKGKKISKSELTFFCNSVDNNLDVINNEIDKIISYTEGREITREDILELIPSKSENDIFNLVDYLSQKKVRKAVDIYNELVFKGEKPTGILRMIQRQYDLLLMLKIGSEKGKSVDILSRELGLHPFICEKMVTQSRKFSKEGLQYILESSLNTEKRIKSLSTDVDTELEMFMIDTLKVK